MRRLLLIAVVLVGCSKETKPEIKYPERLPMTEQVKEATPLPNYQAPTKEGKAVELSEGEPAPFDGILLTEDKAFAAAQLRIAYDELYKLSLADHKFMLFVVTTQEKELYKGDQIIDYKEAQLRELRDSWWQKNKLQVGIVVGIVAGVGLTLATGVVWAKIEEEQQ